MTSSRQKRSPTAQRLLGVTDSPSTFASARPIAEISEDSAAEETGGEDGAESRRSSLLFTINRQLSQTHSEPDTADSSSRHMAMVERSVTWAEPRIKVIPPTSHPRTMLMAMHTEYTSITDELETVCGLLSPPKSPSLLTPPRPGEGHVLVKRRSRHHSEMSNPEMARFLEKEHLRDAEESDYQLMEGLIQRRLRSSDDDKFQNNAFFLATTPELERYQGKLRRASAIEGDMPTPHISTSTTPLLQSPVGGSSSVIDKDEETPKKEEETQQEESGPESSVHSPFPTTKLFKNAQKEVQL